jgi:regulator of sirC expression with transglutaminase-like and TPR domain
VRVEVELVRCYVNGELVCEAPAADFAGDAVGLAKFRNTVAEFKGFQAGTNLARAGAGSDSGIAATLPSDLSRQIEDWKEPDSAESLLGLLEPHADAARLELAERARRLEQNAAALRRMASRLHRQRVASELSRALDQPEPEIDLFRAALLIARHDNPEVDVEAYAHQINELGRELGQSLPAQADDETKLKALREFLFTQHGFHGSRTDYYNRANSYINEVLDDREGLPITLSVLFLELARRIGLDGLAGVPLPGHFMVRYASPRPAAGGELRLIDVFDGGRVISRSEAQERVTETTGQGFREEHLQPASKRDIVVRMLHNLLAIAERSEDPGDALPYADLLVAVSREPGERLTRVRLRLQRNDRAGASEDIQWLLRAQPPGLDLERLNELLDSLKSEPR